MRPKCPTCVPPQTNPHTRDAAAQQRSGAAWLASPRQPIDIPWSTNQCSPSSGLGEPRVSKLWGQLWGGCLFLFGLFWEDHCCPLGGGIVAGKHRSDFRVAKRPEGIHQVVLLAWCVCARACFACMRAQMCVTRIRGSLVWHLQHRRGLLNNSDLSVSLLQRTSFSVPFAMPFSTSQVAVTASITCPLALHTPQPTQSPHFLPTIPARKRAVIQNGGSSVLFEVPRWR